MHSDRKFNSVPRQKSNSLGISFFKVSKYRTSISKWPRQKKMSFDRKIKKHKKLENKIKINQNQKQIQKRKNVCHNTKMLNNLILNMVNQNLYKMNHKNKNKNFTKINNLKIIPNKKYYKFVSVDRKNKSFKSKNYNSLKKANNVCKATYNIKSGLKNPNKLEKRIKQKKKYPSLPKQPLSFLLEPGFKTKTKNIEKQFQYLNTQTFLINNQLLFFISQNFTNISSINNEFYDFEMIENSLFYKLYRAKSKILNEYRIIKSYSLKSLKNKKLKKQIMVNYKFLNLTNRSTSSCSAK